MNMEIITSAASTALANIVLAVIASALLTPVLLKMSISKGPELV